MRQPNRTLDVYAILDDIHSHLDIVSIYTLRAFLNGINDVDQSDAFDFLDEFEEYVQHSFSCAETLSAARIISIYAEASSKNSFDYFFELIEDFCKGDIPRHILRLKDLTPLLIPCQKVECLFAFIQGKDLHQRFEVKPIELDGFSKWVSEYFELNQTCGWDHVIAMHSSSSHTAIELMKTLFAKYLDFAHHMSDRPRDAGRLVSLPYCSNDPDSMCL